MHLLAAQSGEITQEGEAVDLGQTPADLIFVSAADSELAAMAGAIDRVDAQDMRLANFLRLAHNLSVDMWLQNTVAHAKTVVVRLLGGAAYWQYGVDELCALAKQKKIKLALLSGDAFPDAALIERSTVAPEIWHQLHALVQTGGADNFDNLLLAMRSLALAEKFVIAPAIALPKFTLWWPGEGVVDAGELKKRHELNAPNIPILFYRAALDGAGTGTINRLIKTVSRAGMNAVPMVISSLKQSDCIAFAKSSFEMFPPDAFLNLTGFALGLDGIAQEQNPFANTDAPIIQCVQAGRPREVWEKDLQGLSAKDLAMQIVLPELDGRIGSLLVGHKEDSLWHEQAECWLTQYNPDADGIGASVALAKNWAQLRRTQQAQKRVSLVLANYPVRDGRLANGVGYDAPQSTIQILNAMRDAGLSVQDIPASGNALIELLQQGPTNAEPQRGASDAQLSLTKYNELFNALPLALQNQVKQRWGNPETDPFCRDQQFHLAVKMMGNVAVVLQPARGYQLDEDANYHDPDLVPPHSYLATYLWIKHCFSAHAIIHNGKHGNLEWLPGKATALDAAAYPHALWGNLPHLYPFIVNDPGEGTQAKRRTGAVIIDHLVPPLTRAETYGPLKDLEALLDEYYQAQGMDRRRLDSLKKRILDFAKDSALDKDVALPDDENQALGELDNFLCDLKEAQIRDGLHIFGASPDGRLRTDLAVALARVPRGEEGRSASLIRAISDDLGLGFDPLTAKLGDPWTGPKPDQLATLSPDLWRSNGDTVERLELYAARLVEGQETHENMPQTASVLEDVFQSILPKLEACGPAELGALIDGLNGKFIAPGSSGAPSRGRLDVLPTGRNFYSVDTRAVPTPTAWELGKTSAENIVKRHFQDTGMWLQAVALSAWGTANMRTGGDDIAQALALIGAKPKWDAGSLRVSGFEIIPMAKLGRPRVDVTLKISGFFRDAFPQMIALFDRAARAIGSLDEPDSENPIAARMRAEAAALMEDGQSLEDAGFAAGHRIFGSKPGAYGAGLQGLMDGGNWSDKSDLAEAFMNWGQYAYGAKADGVPERERFRARLGQVEAVLHNQDNREHDLLDSDDYYQFEGGLIAATEVISGQKPEAYHSDHSRPERPVTRTLDEEISRVMRSRVVNPKWIDGVKRHGYKGAFEIIATVDYMFAFAATAGAVKTHHFDLAFEAFVLNDETRDFIKQNNPHGFDELIEKFKDAIKRGFWTPKSNSAYEYL